MALLHARRSPLRWLQRPGPSCKGVATLSLRMLSRSGMDVLRHRIILTYEAEAKALTSEAVIQKVFEAVPVP